MKYFSLIFFAFLSTVWCSGQTITSNPDKDNSIYSENSNRSNGQGRLFSGRTCDSNFRRALVKFNLSEIPDGANITSVILNVTVDNFSEDGFAETFNIYALTTEFGEGASSGGGGGATAIAPDATWSDALLGTSAWTQAGGDFDGNILSSVIMASSNGTKTFPSTSNFTAVVQNWINNPNSNFGIIIIGNESNSCSARRFGSKEVGVAPELIVTYSVLDDASFTFPSETYCSNDLDPSPNITGEAGGSFSSSAGLIINASTGVIDVSVSTPGPYIITYTTSSPGENSSSFSIIINPLDDTDFTEDGVTDGDDFSTFLGNFGFECTGPTCLTDLDGDGITDGDDFSIFLGNFGLTCN